MVAIPRFEKHSMQITLVEAAMMAAEIP